MLVKKSLILICFVALISLAALPTAQAVTKVARYAYEANQNQLVGYTVDPASGRLRVIQAVATPNLTGSAITLNPTGKFVYLSTGYNGGTSIYGYAIGSTGLVTPITGSPFSSGGGTLKFAPTGKFAFTNVPSTNSVQVFSVNTTTGVLTTIGFASTGNNPQDLFLTPKGTFLYTPNVNASTISGFSVNPTTGALTPVPGSPFPVSGGAALMAVHPSGKFLYVEAGITISVFSINATTGVLTAAGQFAGPTVNAGYATVSPNGKFLLRGHDRVWSRSLHNQSNYGSAYRCRWFSIPRPIWSVRRRC